MRLWHCGSERRILALCHSRLEASRAVIPGAEETMILPIRSDPEQWEQPVLQTELLNTAALTSELRRGTICSEDSG